MLDGGTHEINDDLIDEYTNYKRLTEVELDKEPEVKSKTVKKGGKDCTIVGPFKIKVGGKKITKVTVGEAEWTPDNTGEIYWATEVSEDPEDWNNRFNTKEDDSEKYLIDGTKFFLAIDSSKLPESGKCKVKMEQAEFEYFTARAIATNSEYIQQMGVYYTGEKKKEHGKASWEFESRITKLKLTVRKKDALTNKPLKAGFKISCGKDKWLVRDTVNNGGYKYNAKEDEAGVYYSDENTGELVLEDLKSGKYNIYEVEPPKGYSLEIQEGYDKDKKWVNCTQKEEIQLTKDTERDITNTPDTYLKLTIKKQDGSTGKPLRAGFKISCGKDKWLGRDKDGSYKYDAKEDEASVFYSDERTGNLVLEHLKSGNYMVYEVEAPKGYTLEAQEGYDSTKKWVPCTKEELKLTKDHNLTVKNILVGLTIIKKDESGKPLDAGFAIYCEGKGWVLGKDGNYTYNNKYSQAKNTPYQTGKEGSITLSGLAPGTYHVYEIKAPDGYDLAQQNDDKFKYQETLTVGGETVTKVVDCGSHKIESGTKTVKVEVVNKLSKTQLIIIKTDEKGNPLDAGFAIYCEGKGWVLGEKGKYTYNNKYSEASKKPYQSGEKGMIILEGLDLGTYHVYEIKAPKGYDLAQQDDDKKKYKYQETVKVGSETLNKVLDCGSKKLDDNTKVIKYDVVNKLPSMQLTIKKKDEKEKPLDAGFAIFCEGKGWLLGEKGKYTYNNKYTEASKKLYQTGKEGSITLTGLKTGTYQVFEIKAPKGYDLENQKGYKASITVKGEMILKVVDCGKKKLSNTTKTIEFSVVNKDAPGKLTIMKKDDGGKAVDAGFRIYYNGVAGSGWLKKGSDKKYTIQPAFVYGDIFSTSGGTLKLDSVPEGEYKIYEVKLPSGNFKWEDQEGYEPGRLVGGQYITYPTVYCGTMAISAAKPNGSITKVNIKGGDKDKGKKDEFGNLQYASFKIYDKNAGKWIKKETGYWTLEESEEKTETLKETIPAWGYSYYEPWKYTRNWEIKYNREKLTASKKSELEQKVSNAKAKSKDETVTATGTKVEIEKYKDDSTVTYTTKESAKYDFQYGEWTYYDYTDDVKEAEVFTTNQYIDIQTGSGNPCWPDGAEKATYEIYEIACTGDYRLQYQHGYNSYIAEGKADYHGLKNARYVGDAKPEDIEKEQYQLKYSYKYYLSERMITDINDDGIEWLTTIVDNNDQEETPTYGTKISAKLWIDTTNNNTLIIKGKVWEDAPNTKAHVYNSLFDEDGHSGKAADDDTIETRTEKGLGGIKVSIKEGSTVVATTTTKSDGTYTFGQNSGIKINKIDDDAYTIEFDYSSLFTQDKTQGDGVFPGDKYIPVKYFENLGNSETIIKQGSKAKADNMPYADVDLPKTAYTAKLKSLLTMEWQKKGTPTYTVSKTNKDATLNYINLGLKKLPETSFGVTEDIDTVRIEMTHKDNDGNATPYTYTYKYGKNKLKFAGSNTPTVKWQNKNDYSVYSADIYPSDVSYSHEKNYNDDGIEVYVTYKMSIVNTVTYNIEELYKESKLIIESVKNKFNASRYELSDKNWTNTASGEATMTDNYLKTVCGGGIDKYSASNPNACIKTAKITYKLTNEELDRIITTGKTTDENAPTRVEAQGYHEYNRKEYTWKQNGSDVKHRTSSMSRSDKAPGMIFKLANPNRNITGRVFEDQITSDSISRGEKLGNGKYESGESPVGAVTVDLLNAETKQVSKLYWVAGGTSRSSSATTKTNNDGTYTLNGVLPGKYILRFTYGNGSVVYSTPNKQASLEKYKSTIVTDEVAKGALKGTNTSDFWYRDMKGTENSVAVDNKDIRKEFNKGTSKSEINADADVIDIAIENTYALEGEANIYYPHIKGLNLGIVEQPKHELELSKVITNIKLTNVQNNVIVEGNPQLDAGQMPGVTDLDMDDSNQGSTFTRIESDEEQITELVPTYTIRIKDNSDIVYYSLDAEHENSYYDFGEHDPSYSRVIAVEPSEVIDYLDPSLEYMTSTYEYKRGNYYGKPNYEIESEPGFRAGYGNANLLDTTEWSTEDEKTQQLDAISGTWKSAEKTYNNMSSYVNEQKNVTGYTYKTLLDFTKINSLIKDDEIEIKMSAKRVFQSDDDTETINNAQITDAKQPQKVVDNPLVKKVILQPYVTTKITITPPTGEDKQTKAIYIITGIGALIILTTGVIVIKKKLL